MNKDYAPHSKLWSLLLSGLLAFALVACGEKENQGYISIQIDTWQHQFIPGETYQVPVVLNKKGASPWEGTVLFQVIRADSTWQEQMLPASAAENHPDTLKFEWVAPAAEGNFEWVAQTTGLQGQPVKSRRLIEVDVPLELEIAQEQP